MVHRQYECISFIVVLLLANRWMKNPLMPFKINFNQWTGLSTLRTTTSYQNCRFKIDHPVPQHECYTMRVAIALKVAEHYGEGDSHASTIEIDFVKQPFELFSNWRCCVQFRTPFLDILNLILNITPLCDYFTIAIQLILVDVINCHFQCNVPFLYQLRFEFCSPSKLHIEIAP